jgi:hypothetical protein
MIQALFGAAGERLSYRSLLLVALATWLLIEGVIDQATWAAVALAFVGKEAWTASRPATEPTLSGASLTQMVQDEVELARLEARTVGPTPSPLPAPEAPAGDPPTDPGETRLRVAVSRRQQ